MAEPTATNLKFRSFMTIDRDIPLLKQLAGAIKSAIDSLPMPK